MRPQLLSPTRLRIVIADDHPLFRKGLRQTIESEPGVHVIREVSDGAAALQAILDLEPELCILDISMPLLDGLEVTRQAQVQKARTEIIILTMYKEEEVFRAAVDLGVKGYVLKECAVSDILDAIRAVRGGHHYISPNLADFFFRRPEGTRDGRGKGPGLDSLTPGERRIVKLISEDKTSKEIARELGLSPRTVENHRTNICAKLNVHGIHGLVKFAYDNKARL